METKEIKLPDSVKREEKEEVLEEVYDSLNTFKASVISENSEFINKEGENMQRFSDQIKKIEETMKKNIEDCEEVIKNLEEETAQLDMKADQYKRQMKANNTEEEYRQQIKRLKEQYITKCKERIKIAEKINMDNLKKIELEDRKSKANEVFKWIMLVMYGQAESKYYWPNFLAQAIENDDGRDLRERLGKINASKSKQQQRVKTESILKDAEAIENSEELKNVRLEIENIFKIAEIFKAGYKITFKIKDCQTKIEKHKENTLLKDEEFMRGKARSDALKDRITINRQYHKVLTDLSHRLSPKQELYKAKSEEAKKISEEFSKLLSWKPTINLSTENKNECECIIF